jgi:hypothetical protein
MQKRSSADHERLVCLRLCSPKFLRPSALRTAACTSLKIRSADSILQCNLMCPHLISFHFLHFIRCFLHRPALGRRAELQCDGDTAAGNDLK